MKVFAHYYKSETTGNDYRWRTLLQFGTSWNIIGSVIMKNPGSAAPLCSVNEPTTLKQLKHLELPKLFSEEPEYAWYSFSCDDTMQKVEKLFCSYYKTSTLNGIIQVFNLMNVRDPNLELALIKNNNAVYPFSKTIEKDIMSLVAPVYLGWGDLWKKQPFREDAEKFFMAVQNKFDGKYLFPQLKDNRFYHPQYLMGVGLSSPMSKFLLNAFCQNTTVPVQDSPIVFPKQISKRNVYEQVVRRLRKEYQLVEEQLKTCRFQFTEELVLTITCTGQGYVGIRHAAYAGRYCLGNYPHITEYRSILSEFGYNIAPEAWLGTKDFKEYEGEENTIVSNIIMEIETIKRECDTDKRHHQAT